MFSISICFGPVGTTWAFLFKTKEAAEKAIINFPSKPAICDDFGQTATFDKVHAYIIEDMSESALAHQARMLHDARIKASAQKAAQTDPQLRAVMGPQGPGIVAPFGR